MFQNMQIPHVFPLFQTTLYTHLWKTLYIEVKRKKATKISKTQRNTKIYKAIFFAIRDIYPGLLVEHRYTSHNHCVVRG